VNGQLAPGPAALAFRAVGLEDVAEVLRLVRRAVEAGCGAHYRPRERDAVVEVYTRSLFVEALGPFESIAAEQGGRLVGFAQLDPAASRLRALFVDGEHQGTGKGRALLAEIEARARRRGCARLHGAMSLNAVPFYAAAGFVAADGPPRLMSVENGVTVPIVRMEKQLKG